MAEAAQRADEADPKRPERARKGSPYDRPAPCEAPAIRLDAMERGC